jgi:5-methylcytosine-specific restriction endonuclease McrA
LARYRGKYYSPKRRAKYAQGDEIDHVTLFNLYGWTCHVCWKQIEPHRRFPDFSAATVDHIVPLCQGGTHTWDNVQPAHRSCNEAKGGLDMPGVPVLDLRHAPALPWPN